MFGRLTFDSFKHNLVEAIAGVSMGVGILVIVAILFYLRRWKWLWREWLTSVDPKRIGVMYLTVGFLMLVKALIDAGMMRLQQAYSVGESFGYMSGSHYQQVFTAHGTTMIFFVGMATVFGALNLVVPLQIGARDVAFSFINAVAFWLFAVGAALLVISLVIGNFSGAGWVAYPPLSELAFMPDVGPDYWIWSVQIAGIGSLLSGINFLTTIFKLRCPGLKMMKTTVFVWSALGTLVLIVFAFPILTATLFMLAFDRLLGMHFFTADFGGNPMMYVNLIWAWGHPEVYILILPAFGIFSEIVPTFSRKRLFGYHSMVWAIVGITFLSFIVWLHHFFTMGAPSSVNAFFGLMTMLIAIPTGVKVFNWIFTQCRGDVQFASPMLWFLGFILTFTVGGMAGILLSVPPIDFQVHNSLFLIAHFHTVIIGGVIFGFFAGFTYWFPKVVGFKLNEKLGILAFWLWFAGFLTAFMPLYLLGLMGATRRLNHYDAGTGWQPLFVVAGVGVFLILCGLGVQILQLIVSIRRREANRDLTGDPWNGRTLEWATLSPPPLYNFALVPQVESRDPFWNLKKAPPAQPSPPEFGEIEVPKNSSMPFFIGCSSLLFGFGLTWHMWWLGIVGFVGILVFVIIRLSDKETLRILSAAEVEEIEARRGFRARYAWK
jgi:cytochrome o ubiquinol oxidase subunit I